MEYKPGAQNTVADALSRRDTDRDAEDGAVLALSVPRFDFLDRLRHAQDTDPALVALREEVTAGTRAAPWAVQDGLLTYDGRIYISSSSPLLQELLTAIHDDGHEGVQRTLRRLRRDFHFPGMRTIVQDFVRACATCQRYKAEHLHPAGLLLPLPVPTAVWTDIGLDFVEALPKVCGKSVILTVVDRFCKYCHFIPLAHPYSAESVAQAFFAEIVRLHGMPQSMVSDRDPVFTSTFWKELMRLMGAKMHMTTAFHPQSDGQTEAANRVITMYLRCFTGDRPRQWLRWLPWAEFIYNTAYQTSLRDTPFRIVYGRDPPTIRSYEPGETRCGGRQVYGGARRVLAGCALPPGASADGPETPLRQAPSCGLLQAGRLGAAPTTSPPDRLAGCSGHWQAEAPLLRTVSGFGDHQRRRGPAGASTTRPSS